jgi:aminoglycoside phosphotransferase (APT) family kinase protein
LVAQLLGAEVDVERARGGVATFVYRVRFGRDTLYLRIWPFVDESFESEALILQELQRRGVHVPEVLGWEASHPLIGRSYLLTSGIAGRPLGPEDPPARIRDVLLEAGHELSLLNSIPIEGFGWIMREPGRPLPLRGQHTTCRDFTTQHLEADLGLLASRVFGLAEVAALQRLIEDHTDWLDAPEAHLAHGDFDTTPILHEAGRYSGIIDFSEVRGTSWQYDLGHFHLHDGHRLPVLGFRWLAEGYRRGTRLAADDEQQVAFQGLLIGIRRLARSVRLRPAAVAYQDVMAAAVRRELTTLS